MSKTVEFYFDFGSPTAYLAHTQLKLFAEKYNVEVVYKPMLLGGVHKATNNIPPGAVPAKGQYMMVHDLPRYIKRYGVPFKMNPFFPINTLALMRGCYAAKEMGCFEQYVEAIFNGMWVQAANLGDPAVIAETLQQADIDPEKFLALISSAPIKEALKEDTGNAVARGIFGAPTMFIGDDMYFGQDRLDFIEEAIQ